IPLVGFPRVSMCKSAGEFQLFLSEGGFSIDRVEKRHHAFLGVIFTGDLDILRSAVPAGRCRLGRSRDGTFCICACRTRRFMLMTLGRTLTDFAPIQFCSNLVFVVLAYILMEEPIFETALGHLYICFVV